MMLADKETQDVNCKIMQLISRILNIREIEGLPDDKDKVTQFLFLLASVCRRRYGFRSEVVQGNVVP